MGSFDTTCGGLDSGDLRSPGERAWDEAEAELYTRAEREGTFLLVAAIAREKLQALDRAAKAIERAKKRAIAVRAECAQWQDLALKAGQLALMDR